MELSEIEMSENESIQQCVSTRPSRNAKNKAKKMNCSELGNKIKELIDTEKRGRCGPKGLIQRFRDYRGDDLTHGPQYTGQQSALRSYLDEFSDKGCGPPPPGAFEWVEKALPSPRTEEGAPGDVAKSVAVGAGVATIAYGVYRVLRFLPSLFPALWPTIPGNLAIP